MHIIGLLNLKGGAGKTSVAVGAAGALQALGERVAVLDMDPQRSASRWAPAGLAVHSLDDAAAKSARAVKARLEELAGEGFTYALLDLPPSLEDRSLTAAMLAHLVLVPTTASPLDVWATEDAVSTARDARAVRDDGLPLVALVPSRVVSSTVLGRELPEALAGFGEALAPGISQRVAVAEAALAHQTVTAYAPGSPSDEEFRELAKFIRRILAPLHKAANAQRSK